MKWKFTSGTGSELRVSSATLELHNMDATLASRASVDIRLVRASTLGEVAARKGLVVSSRDWGVTILPQWRPHTVHGYSRSPTSRASSNLLNRLSSPNLLRRRLPDTRSRWFRKSQTSHGLPLDPRLRPAPAPTSASGIPGGLMSRAARKSEMLILEMAASGEDQASVGTG